MKFLLLLCYTVLLTNAELCPKRFTIDITSGIFNRKTKSITHKGVVFPEDKYYNDKGVKRGCICEVKTCVKLCCKIGEAKIDDECQKHDWKLQLDIYDFDNLVQKNEDYHIISDQHDCKGFIMDPQEGDNFYVQKNGSLYEPNGYIGFLSFEHYCLTTFSVNNVEPQAYICLSEVPVEDDFVIANSFGMIISIPFLIITLIVYCLLPSHKRNVGTKCQMAYVLSLTCAYLFLVIIQMNSLTSGPCKALATLCLYSFMSSFCWMNISCIDIYWTFSGKGGYSRGFNNGRSRQFYFYCLYAYGFPFALVSVIFGINTLENKNYWFHPNFGENQCWLKEGFPLLLYFYGPMGILLICNVTLFMLTAFKIRKLDRESSMVRKDDNKKHYESDKQRFNVYFKLLIALGINWTLEFISWLVDWSLGTKKIPQIWYVTDLCNALYGVFIFYLFVCKKSIWIMLQKRYYICMGQHQKARTIGTRTSNYQTSDTEKTNIDESTVNTTKV